MVDQEDREIISTMVLAEITIMDLVVTITMAVLAISTMEEIQGEILTMAATGVILAMVETLMVLAETLIQAP